MGGSAKVVFSASRAAWVIAIGMLAASACALFVANAAVARPSGKAATPKYEGLHSKAGTEKLKKRERARRAKLKSPAVRKARRRSRLAHADLNRGAALGVARRNFDKLLATPAWAGLNLRGNQRVKEYTDDFTALVDTGPGTDKALAQSTLPLVAPDEHGNKRPIDQSLRATGAGYEMKNPLIDIRFDKHAGKGFKFERSGLGVRFDGAAPGATAEAVNDKLFYANIAPDTDGMVMPVPGGVETFAQIRSVESPETHTLALDLPQGAKLETVDSPPSEPDSPEWPLAVTRGDQTVAAISKPRAWDSDDRPVPVSYSIEGGKLRMQVDHRSGDYRYPIMLDPHILQDFRLWKDFRIGNHNGWYTWSNTGPWGHQFGDGYLGWGWRGLHVWGDANYPYPYMAQGEWAWRAQGSSFISQVEYFHLRHIWAWSCAYLGIWNNQGGTWDSYGPRRNCDNNWQGDTYEHLCVNNNQPPCPIDQGSAGNHAMAGLMMEYGPGARGSVPYLYFGGAVIWNGDREAPSIQHDYVYDYADGAAPGAPKTPTGWLTGGVRRVRASATDPGLGMRQFSLVVPRDPELGGGNDIQHRDRGCTGSRVNNSTCDSLYRLPDHGGEFTYNVDTLPEGINKVGLLAYDPTYQYGATDWTVKVDRSAPLINVAGDAWDSDTVTEGSHPLRVNAQDGADGEPESGVASLQLQVDGVTQQTINNTCGGDSCGQTETFSPNLTPGERTITIVATDRAGLSDSISTRVHVDPVPTASGVTTASLSSVTQLRLDGAGSGDKAGAGAVGIGDVSGDGVDDYVVGSPTADNNSRGDSGSAYVVYGGAGGVLNLNSLGTRGYRIDGAAVGDRAGATVSGGGDVNGDGVGDVLVGGGGAVHAIFGSLPSGGNPPANVDLANLGTRGFKILGATDASAALAGGGTSKRFGEALAATQASAEGATDVNGDGFGDIVIGSSSEGSGTGAAYVVFGKTTSGTVDTRHFGGSPGTRVSYWRLGETTGTQASDLVGTNHGTYGGGYTLGQPGAVADGDPAVTLDGITGNVNLGNPANLQLANGTVDAWVKSSNPGSGFRGIVTKQGAYGLFMNDGQLVTYDWGADAVRSTGINIADGKWHHVALTFQSGVTNGTVVYLDGVPKLTTTITAVWQGTNAFVGTGGYAGSVAIQHLNGSVDEPVIYSSALSAADISRQYYRRMGFRVQGVPAGEGLGYAVASLGDTNNDGLTDVGLTAPGQSGTATEAAYVVYGANTWGTVDLTSPGGRAYSIKAPSAEKLGSSIARVGDVDADALTDFAVGGQTSYVLRGTEGTSAVDVTSPPDENVAEKVVAPADTAYQEATVAPGGDVNDDNRADVVVGYPKVSSGTQQGVSYAIYPDPDVGGTTTLSNLGPDGVQLTGSVSGDQLGASVSSATAAPPGEAAQRLVVSAPGTDPNGESSGSVYIVNSLAIAQKTAATRTCWTGATAYPYSSKADFRYCRWTLKNGKPDVKDETPRPSSHRQVGRTALTYGMRINDGNQTPIYDSFHQLIGYIKQSGKKQFKVYDRNGTHQGTTVAPKTPITAASKPRLEIVGPQCMADKSKIRNYVMIILKSPSFRSVFSGSETKKDINIRGMIDKNHIPAGAVRDYVKGGVHYSNDQYYARFHGDCGPQSSSRRNPTENITTAPFNPAHDNYQGSESILGGADYSNYYKPFFSDRGSSANPVNILTDNPIADVIMLTSSTTGVRGGGLVRAIVRRGRGIYPLSEFGYEDSNVPCDRPYIARWRYLDANPRPGSNELHIRGWVARKPAGDIDSFSYPNRRAPGTNGC